MHESVLGSLICIIVDRVPLAFRLDRMGVLFCLINEKSLLPLHCYGGLPKKIRMASETIIIGTGSSRLCATL